MKPTSFLCLLALGCIVIRATAQGTFVYDQQSSDENSLGSGATDISSSQPFGQSFTPSLSGVGFVRLYLSDGAINSIGTRVSVNLRENSITGNVLAVTAPVTVSDRFIGAVNFYFPTNIAVTSQQQYFFQPVVEAGESFRVYAYNAFNYPGGTAFHLGTVSPFFDLWFREGIYNVPEPSAAALGLLGGAWLAWVRRSRFPSS